MTWTSIPPDGSTWTPQTPDQTFITSGYWVDESIYGTLNDAISAATASGKTLLITNECTISGSLTISVPVKVIKGGSFIKGLNGTLTINGPFVSDMCQIFSGFSAGDITFGAGSAKEVYPEWFGAIRDNGLSDDTAFALATASLSNGGTLYLSNGQYDLSSQWMLSSGSNITQNRKPLRIVGAGSDQVGIGGVYAPTGGTIVNMTYGSGPKISTTSQGHIEITGVNFYNNGSDTQAFIYTEGTTLFIHHNAFWGGPNRNDGIVFGGITDGTGFQGYGTVIDSNFFARVSRAAYLRRWANAIVIRDNSIWLTGGGDAAIELDGISPQSISGVVITGNLIEMANYTYGVKISNTNNSYFAGNGFFDGTYPSVSYYCATSNAAYNTFIEGMTGNPGLGFITEHPSGLGTNTIIRNQQAERSSMGSGTMDFYSYPNVQIFSGYGPTIYSGTTNSTWRQRYRAFNIGGTYQLENHFINAAGDTVAYGPSVKVYPNGSWVNATTDFEELVGTLRIKTPAGKAIELWGDSIRLKDSAGNVNSIESMPYSAGSWTPTPHNLTVVGTPTYTGTYTKIGNVVHIVLEVAATTSTVASASWTYFTGIPYPPASGSTVVAASLSTGAGYGTGAMAVNGDIYVPAWSADASVVVTLTYKAA